MAQNNVLAEGIEYYNSGKYPEALTFFLALPEGSGADSIDLAYYIGLCYLKLKRYDDALLYLEQVVTSAVNINRVLQCRLLLAVIYCQSGRKRLADFELNKLLETGYRRGDVYAALAYVAWQQQQVDKCLEYYNESLKAAPDNTTALNGTGYVLACENRDLTKALAYCKKAHDQSPQSPACLDSLGWVYFKMGLNDDAKKYLEMALKKAPDNPEIKEHIRLLRSQGGQK